MHQGFRPQDTEEAFEEALKIPPPRTEFTINVKRGSTAWHIVEALALITPRASMREALPAMQYLAANVLHFLLAGATVKPEEIMGIAFDTDVEQIHVHGEGIVTSIHRRIVYEHPAIRSVEIAHYKLTYFNQD